MKGKRVCGCPASRYTAVRRVDAISLPHRHSPFRHVASMTRTHERHSPARLSPATISAGNLPPTLELNTGLRIPFGRTYRPVWFLRRMPHSLPSSLDGIRCACSSLPRRPALRDYGYAVRAAILIFRQCLDSWCWFVVIAHKRQHTCAD